MSTLLLTLAGPMQSWGSRSRFTTRGTELAPTKSGVVGLLAAALGLERTASLDRFESLRFGVRIDQPGRLERDFQTARTLDGSASMPLSTRHYLVDAVFLAGLEGDDRALLEQLSDAVRRPVFPLYLGRRAFPPSPPIKAEIVDEALEPALCSAPWRAGEWYRRTHGEGPISLEYSLEALPGETATGTLRDAPLSFDPRRREYGWRDIREGRVELPGPAAESAPNPADAGSGDAGPGSADAVSADAPAEAGAGMATPRRHDPFDALTEGP